MDVFTWGFVAVILLLAAAKFLFDWRMYKNSVYPVFYAGYTEYRMRKKSVEGMSESYALKDDLGAHRLLYHALRDTSRSPNAFVTLFLTDGIYVCGVVTGQKPQKDALRICREFFAENVEKRLRELTLWREKPLPVTYRIVLPDKSAYAENTPCVKRAHLLAEIKKLRAEALRKGGGTGWSEAQLEQGFRAAAADALREEKASSLSFLLTKDKEDRKNA